MLSHWVHMANSRSSKQTLADVWWTWQILLQVAMVSWRECNFEMYPVCLDLWYFDLAVGNCPPWLFYGTTSRKNYIFWQKLWRALSRNASGVFLEVFSLRTWKWDEMVTRLLSRSDQAFHLLAQQVPLPKAIPLKWWVTPPLTHTYIYIYGLF